MANITVTFNFNSSEVKVELYEFTYMESKLNDFVDGVGLTFNQSSDKFFRITPLTSTPVGEISPDTWGAVYDPQDIIWRSESGGVKETDTFNSDFTFNIASEPVAPETTTVVFNFNSDHVSIKLMGKPAYDPVELHSFVDGMPFTFPTSDALEYQVMGVDSEVEIISIMPDEYGPDYDPIPVGWNKSTSGGKVVWSVDFFDEILDFTITSIGGSVDGATPFNRSHVMGYDELIELGNYPLYQYTTDSSGGRKEIANKAIYIINLIQFPFKIPESYYPDSTTIELGRYDTEILAPTLNDDVLLIDLGNIEIDSTVGSSLDYEQTEFELFLPFINDVIDLEPSLVIGETVNIKYLIDIYSGDLTVNVYTNSPEPIKTIQSTIGRELPIKSRDQTEAIISSESGVRNDILSAYVRYSKPELLDGTFNNLVVKEGVLLGNVGYVEVLNMVLKTKANYNEQQQILNILSGGVIINE